MRDRPAAAGVAWMAAVVAAAAAMVLGIHVEVVVLGAVVVVIGAVGVSAMVLGIRHTLLAARLRRGSRDATVDGVHVAVVPGVVPAVAGLVRPTIFVDDDLLADLEPTLRRAVLLHEQAHRDLRHPARLVVLGAVRRCMGWMPKVAAAEQSARARLEIRADRQAISQGVARRHLAAALLQMSSGPYATTTMAAFDAAVDQRLLALLGDREARPALRLRWRVVAVVAVVIVGAAVVAVSGTAHPEFGWIMQCLEGSCSIP